MRQRSDVGVVSFGFETRPSNPAAWWVRLDCNTHGLDPRQLRGRFS